MFKETLYQAAADGTPFVQCLERQGVLPGIKVDEVRMCVCVCVCVWGGYVCVWEPMNVVVLAACGPCSAR